MRLRSPFVLLACVLLGAGILAQGPPAGTPAPAGVDAGRQGVRGGPAGPGGAAGARGGTPIQPGEECPPGMTEVRPRSCQAPEFPAPSIVDYRPKSTLVTSEHLVPKAKFPVVDIHGHPTNWTTPQ